MNRYDELLKGKCPKRLRLLGLNEVYELYRLEDRQLERALIQQIRLPEDQWPGHPGDAWYGRWGASEEVVVGWEPARHTGDVTIVDPETGETTIVHFVDGKAA